MRRPVPRRRPVLRVPPRSRGLEPSCFSCSRPPRSSLCSLNLGGCAYARLTRSLQKKNAFAASFVTKQIRNCDAARDGLSRFRFRPTTKETAMKTILRLSLLVVALTAVVAPASASAASAKTPPPAGLAGVRPPSLCMGAQPQDASDGGLL